MSNTKETGMDPTKRPNCERVAEYIVVTESGAAICELHRGLSATEARVAALERQAAPVPAPASPRAFVVGDVITTPHGGGAQYTVQRVETSRGRLYFTKDNEPFQSWVLAREATLVPAAPAAAPGEVDLVERMAAALFTAAKVLKIDFEPYGGFVAWPDAAPKNRTRALDGARAILSALRAEGRLVEPGEIAALRAERDQARAALATEEAAHKEDHRVLDGRVQRAEEEVRAWRARGQEAEAARDAAFSKETALRRDLLAWNDAAHEAARAQDEFKRRLAEAEEALDAERKAHTVTCATLTKAVEEREAARAELDVERRTGLNGAGEPVVCATREHRVHNVRRRHADFTEACRERDALRAELAALKAKRTRRTKKVTEADIAALWNEHEKDEYTTGGDEVARAARALGFRRVAKP